MKTNRKYFFVVNEDYDENYSYSNYVEIQTYIRYTIILNRASNEVHINKRHLENQQKLLELILWKSLIEE